MMNKILFILITSLLFLWMSCAQALKGTLTDARDYCTTQAVDGDHEFVSFSAMKANLPAGILTDDGKFVYLAIESERLARWATKTIKVEGEKELNGRLVRPEKIWVKTEKGWEIVDFQRPKVLNK